MTEGAPEKRKWMTRRRVVGAVVVLAGAWFWLSRGRIDSRFVGRWINSTPTFGARAYGLDADGSAREYLNPDFSGSYHLATWSVSGDIVTVTPVRHARAQIWGWGYDQIMMRLELIWREFRRGNQEAHYRILEVTPTTVTIQQLNPATMKIEPHMTQPIRLRRD
jgi:hypothetical protein